MPLPDNSDSSGLQRAIALIEEALGILDMLGLTLAAVKLAEARDFALKAQMDEDKS